MPWLVVKFTESDEIEAVPECWYNKSKKTVLYPPFPKNRMEKAIKHETEPGEDWREYSVVLMRDKKYDTFRLACSKATKCCVTSDLSEVDVVSHKRQPKKKSYSSDSDTESDLEMPPIRKDTNQTKSQIDSVANATSVRFSESTLSESLVRDDFSKNSGNDLGEVSISTDDNKFKKTCIAMLVKTNKLLRDLEEKLGQISTEINNISLSLKEKTQQSEENQGEIVDFFTDFPIKSEEMLNHIENTLKSEAAFKNLVDVLCRIGGKDFKECSRRFLKKVLDDKFASEYSLHGHKQKKNFKHTKLCTCVLDAIQRCNKNISMKEIEVVVSAYLAKATERMKRQQAASGTEDSVV